MNFHRLPLGIAGVLAGLFGATGCIVGMAQVCRVSLFMTQCLMPVRTQVWYIGPIGKLAGTAFGADLGFEACFSGHCCSARKDQLTALILKARSSICSSHISSTSVVGDPLHRKIKFFSHLPNCSWLRMNVTTAIWLDCACPFYKLLAYRMAHIL